LAIRLIFLLKSLLLCFIELLVELCSCLLKLCSHPAAQALCNRCFRISLLVIDWRFTILVCSLLIRSLLLRLLRLCHSALLVLSRGLSLILLSVGIILCFLISSSALILLEFVSLLDDFVHHSLAERLLLASRLFFLLKSFLFCIIELLIEFCTSFKELRSNLLPKFTSVQLLFLPLLILGWRFWFLHLLRSLLS